MANRNFRSRSPLAVRGPRRETLWFSSADETNHTPLAAGGVALISSLNAGALALRPFTVIRTVGLIYVASDQTAAFEVPFGGLGLAVVSDQAAAIGVTAVPTPITDESSDLWFLYQFWVASGAGQAASQSNGARVFAFDSRAMRKVPDGADVVTVIENGSAFDGAEFVVKLRMLIKLH